ncbi:MAG: hexameric tyrosine-coordinated heme protein [Balneolaceae bacterium]|nr:hexameric tyrosine-coordinated heme protein [Balneolaceae bacterium]
MKTISLLLPIFLLVSVTNLYAQAEMESEQKDETELSLITQTPEEGFQVAVQLARKGVTTTQPNKEVLFMLRDVYSKDPDALIASSQVIAIHFQTVAAANNYWRDNKESEN